MLIVDRVLCDCCGPALNKAPDLVICPDCIAMAEVIRDPSQAE